MLSHGITCYIESLFVYIDTGSRLLDHEKKYLGERQLMQKLLTVGKN